MSIATLARTYHFRDGSPPVIKLQFWTDGTKTVGRKMATQFGTDWLAELRSNPLVTAPAATWAIDASAADGSAGVPGVIVLSLDVDTAAPLQVGIRYGWDLWATGTDTPIVSGTIQKDGSYTHPGGDAGPTTSTPLGIYDVAVLGEATAALLEVDVLTGGPGPAGPPGGVASVDGKTGAVDLSDTYATQAEVSGGIRATLPLSVSAADDFRTDAVNTLPPALDGGTYTIGGAGANNFSVSGGYLGVGAPASGSTLNVIYALRDVGAPPKMFALRAKFDDTTRAVAMISTALNRITVGDPWLHLSINATNWALSYITNPGGVVTFNYIATGVFTTPLSTGVDHEFKWYYDASDSSLILLFPGPTSLVTYAGNDLSKTGAYGGGTLIRVTDPNITANIGRYIIIEPSQDDAGNQARIKSYSAAVEDGGAYPTPWATGLDLLHALGGIKAAPKLLYVTADIALTSQTAFQTLLALQHTISLNNQLYTFDGVIYYDAPTATQLKFSLEIDGAAMQWGVYTVEALGAAESSTDAASYHQAKALGVPLANLGTAGPGVMLRATIKGTFMSGAGLATLVPKYAQGVSSTTALTIRQGSWLRLTPEQNIAA